MSGNPVRIRDGCATVTGYKLPLPLIHSVGKAGARLSPKSGYRFGCARLEEVRSEKDEVRRSKCEVTRLGFLHTSNFALRPSLRFSVKEKDEARPVPLVRKGIRECLHSPFCREMKAFLFLSSSFSFSPSLSILQAGFEVEDEQEYEDESITAIASQS